MISKLYLVAEMAERERERERQNSLATFSFFKNEYTNPLELSNHYMQRQL